MKLPEILTAKQTAEYLGITTGGLANMRYQGKGPRWTKAGREIRYTADAIRDYLEANERTTTAA